MWELYQCWCCGMGRWVTTKSVSNYQVLFRVSLLVANELTWLWLRLPFTSLVIVMRALPFINICTSSTSAPLTTSIKVFSLRSFIKLSNPLTSNFLVSKKAWSSSFPFSFSFCDSFCWCCCCWCGGFCCCCCCCFGCCRPSSSSFSLPVS